LKLVFEWDETKAGHNLRKHRVGFEEAKTVFNDALLITFPDILHSRDEQRYLSIGLSIGNRILLVVHTEREEGEELTVVRIISSRKATPSERRTYEQKED
jgi:uncharacterized DUF497 family protein